MTRRSTRLQAVDQRLSERDRQLVLEVVRLRFLSAGQLERLFFHGIAEPVTRARRARRQLARLVELELLWRLERRVGGVRAGSTGYIYGATAEARRLAAWWRAEPLTRAQSAHEPGSAFVEHSLACSELFVQLAEAERTESFELLEHQAEPDCWRRFLGAMGGQRHLRPDAFVSIGVGEWEQLAFIEIDRGSEGSAALARKLEVYVAYWRSGAEQHQRDIFPKVVWLVTKDRRLRPLRREIALLPPDTQGIFAVATFDAALDELLGSRGAT